MKTVSALLFTALAAMSAFGQEASVSMSPTEVTAGKTITVTIKVNDESTVNGTKLIANIVSDNPKDSPSGFDVQLYATSSNPKVYTGSIAVPATGKGTWHLERVLVWTETSGASNLDINHPKLLIYPTKVTLPTTGKAEITVP